MQTDKNIMTAAADNLRVLIASMVEQAKSGHPGGSMGAADFINTLYSRFLVYDPKDPHWFARDRFFLDPGHMSTMLYGVLAFAGKYDIQDLRQFRQWGSVTPGHPELDVERGIENASGPLGQGHAMAVGCAIAERFIVARFGEEFAHKTYAFISDGGIQEEISQGAGRLAGYLGLHNLIMFYDSNSVQLSTTTAQVTAEDTASKYRAWGWNVIEINGNDNNAIADALEKAIDEKNCPTLIIGHTVMAKGAVKADGTTLEGAVSTHGQPLSAAGADIDRTIENLGGDPANRFEIRHETKQLYERRTEELTNIVAARRSAEAKWAAQNPEKSRQLEKYIAGCLPEVPWQDITFKSDMASRNASANILGVLARHVGNMIVSSADLANSDKTDGFLKQSRAISPKDFGGGFLHAGVAELTMASVMNGIILHGGTRAACGTFFVFSDYIKPALRMSALMQLPVVYTFSHDSFRVGEDGPTHQPVEHEAQMRLLELMDNLSGHMSALVLRPADSAETLECWQMALENSQAPTILIFSRQDLTDLPGMDADRRISARGTRKGGYTVYSDPTPSVTLTANGSDVSLLFKCLDSLHSHGVQARICSMPSTGLFMRQDKSYRDSVLDPALPCFAVTSGLPATFAPLLMHLKKFDIFGLERFGASAPYKVLEQKFGFAPDNIADRILSFLKR